jgi:hypothetical protein
MKKSGFVTPAHPMPIGILSQNSSGLFEDRHDGSPPAPGAVIKSMGRVSLKGLISANAETGIHSEKP